MPHCLDAIIAMSDMHQRTMTIVTGGSNQIITGPNDRRVGIIFTCDFPGNLYIYPDEIIPANAVCVMSFNTNALNFIELFVKRHGGLVRRGFSYQAFNDAGQLSVTELIAPCDYWSLLEKYRNKEGDG